MPFLALQLTLRLRFHLQSQQLLEMQSPRPSFAPWFRFPSVLCRLPNAVLRQDSIPCLLALPLLFNYFLFLFVCFPPSLPPLSSSVAKCLFFTECQRPSGKFQYRIFPVFASQLILKWTLNGREQKNIFILSCVLTAH